jgi:hypothetical protein
MNPSENDSSDTWAVHRQDDNGNRFIVCTGVSHEEAERMAAQLEARAQSSFIGSSRIAQRRDVQAARMPTLESPALRT